MSTWNSADTPRDGAAGETPTNGALLDAIRDARAGTAMHDLRPLHRAVIAAELWVPLHEPPEVTSQGTRLRYLTVEDDTVLCVFTGQEPWDDFFQSYDRPLTTHVASGREVCRMAASAGLSRIILNPNAPLLYAMHPPVFRTLAGGVVPAGVSQSFPGSAGGASRAAFVAAILPSADALSALTLALSKSRFHPGGATEATWFGALTPDDETFFGLAVACSPERFREVEAALTEAWIAHWPVPTPLWVFPLGDDPSSEQIRATGETLFRPE